MQAGANSKSSGHEPFPCRIQRETVEADGCAATKAIGPPLADSLAKRQLFGRRSEKVAALDPNQLSLFDLFPPIGQEEEVNDRNAGTFVVSKAGPEGKRKQPSATGNCWKTFRL